MNEEIFVEWMEIDRSGCATGKKGRGKVLQIVCRTFGPATAIILTDTRIVEKSLTALTVIAQERTQI